MGRPAQQNGSLEREADVLYLAELDDPVVAREYIGPVRASDHNLYVKGDRVYESNYGSGLRVLDISDRENPHEIAFFDSAPMNDDEPEHSAGQTWYNGRVLEGTSVMGAVAARHDIDQPGEASGGRRTQLTGCGDPTAPIRLR